MMKQSLRTNDCINEVISAYSDMVYRIAVARVRSKTDADDVFQEVFIRYFQKEISFESEEHRRNWIIRVTLLCCKKYWSSSWKKKVVPMEKMPDMPYEMSEKEYGVYEAMLRLPAKYRTVIQLFYYEELSVKQISEALEIRESTVRSQLTRGRAMLKEILKGENCYE